MKILLATDGSDHSSAAVEEVATRSFPPGSEVLIISAFESTELLVSATEYMGGLTGFYKDADNHAQKVAENAIEVASATIEDKNPALKISKKVIFSSPKQGILDEADAFNADLIVVGSHGRGGFSRFLLGSVSQAVALHADCSVQIVRKRELEEEK